MPCTCVAQKMLHMIKALCYESCHKALCYECLTSFARWMCFQCSTCWSKEGMMCMFISSKVTNIEDVQSVAVKNWTKDLRTANKEMCIMTSPHSIINLFDLFIFKEIIYQLKYSSLKIKWMNNYKKHHFHFIIYIYNQIYYCKMSLDMLQYCFPIAIVGEIVNNFVPKSYIFFFFCIRCGHIKRKKF